MKTINPKAAALIFMAFPTVGLKRSKQLFLLCSITAVLLFSFVAPSFAATIIQKLYWTDSDSVHRANVNGTGIESLVVGLQAPSQLSYDPNEEKIYWPEFHSNPRMIRRSDLDGSNVEDVVGAVGQSSGLARDLVNGHMYWSTAFGDSEAIHRTDLDGSNYSLILNTDKPRQMALDIAAGKMYWTNSNDGGDAILRADLDGFNEEVLVPEATSRFVAGIALDLAAGKMYWSDSDNGVISRTDLDGSNLEDLVTGLGFPGGIALDLNLGHLYWTDDSTDKIQRANLDGSDVTDILTGLNNPNDVILVPITVPEPSTFILALLALLTPLAYGHRRCRT